MQQNLMKDIFIFLIVVGSILLSLCVLGILIGIFMTIKYVNDKDLYVIRNRYMKQNALSNKCISKPNMSVFSICGSIFCCCCMGKKRKLFKERKSTYPRQKSRQKRRKKRHNKKEYEKRKKRGNYSYRKVSEDAIYNA